MINLLKKMWQRVAIITDRVGTFPQKVIYVWEDHASWLTAGFAFAFFLSRLFSPLQWIKYLFRLSVSNKKAHKNKRRPNFHAQYTEYYFIVILSLVFILNYINYNHLITYDGYIKIFLLVVLFENFIWISYYLLWRKFIERNYTLYNPAEYLVIFPVNIAIQVLCLCQLLGVEHQIIMKWLLGNVGNDTENKYAPMDAYVGIVGWYYLTVLIANVQSMIPKTEFKESDDIAIIGAGDVVANRLLPALVDIRKDQNFGTLMVASLGVQDDHRQSIKNLQQKPKNHVDLKIFKDTPEIMSALYGNYKAIFIATPSDQHLSYVRKFIGSKSRIICEKPFSNIDNEVLELSALMPHADSLFALSYYSLEKALPLNYFLFGNRVYEKYLDITTSDVLSIYYGVSPTLDDLRSILGAPKSINIQILEGKHRSPQGKTRLWTENDGGLCYETGIHLLLLIYKCLNGLLPLSFQAQKRRLEQFNPSVSRGFSQDSQTPKSVSFLYLSHSAKSLTAGNKSDPEITLSVGKYIEGSLLSRKGYIIFEHGRIDFDFDDKSLALSTEASDKPLLRIAIKPEYQANYAVQCDLAFRFINEGWQGARYDDFYDQLDVLDWIRINHRKIEAGNGFLYSYNNIEQLKSFFTENT